MKFNLGDLVRYKEDIGAPWNKQWGYVYDVKPGALRVTQDDSVYIYWFAGFNKSDPHHAVELKEDLELAAKAKQ